MGLSDKLNNGKMITQMQFSYNKEAPTIVDKFDQKLVCCICVEFEVCPKVEVEPDRHQS
jgi:hypothetical protein